MVLRASKIFFSHEDVPGLYGVAQQDDAVADQQVEARQREAVDEPVGERERHADVLQILKGEK